MENYGTISITQPLVADTSDALGRTTMTLYVAQYYGDSVTIMADDPGEWLDVYGTVTVDMPVLMCGDKDDVLCEIISAARRYLIEHGILTDNYHGALFLADNLSAKN